jgi:hypothetical protein
MDKADDPKGGRSRAGRYVRQPTGYRAFLPNVLPPDPPVKVEGRLHACRSDFRATAAP